MEEVAKLAERDAVLQRLQQFDLMMFTARILSRIGFEAMTDFPKHLPQPHIARVRQAFELFKAGGGLKWVEVEPGKWVAPAEVPEPDDHGICNDIVAVGHILRTEGDEHGIIAQFALEQSVIVFFAQVDALLQDLVRFACKAEPRILTCKKQISWEEVLRCADWQGLILQLTEKCVFDFGYKTIAEKIDFFKKDLGISIEVPNGILKQIDLAEQARHLFVHCGGIVSDVFLQRTGSIEYEKGERLIVTIEYCDNLSKHLIQLAHHVVSEFIEKFFSEPS